MDTAIIQQFASIEQSLRDAHATVQIVQHLSDQSYGLRDAYIHAARMMASRVANELMTIQAQLKGGDK